MSESERDIEQLLHRVTPSDLDPIPWSDLIAVGVQRRRRRRTALAIVVAVLVVGGVGLFAALASSPPSEVRVVDDDGESDSGSLGEGFDLATGFTQVFPPDFGDAEPTVYEDPADLVADFAEQMLRWPSAEVSVSGDDAEVVDVETGRRVAIELGRGVEDGWVIERAGGRLTIDARTGDPVVDRPTGTEQIVVAATDRAGVGLRSMGLGTAAGPALPVRFGPVDEDAIVVAATYDGQGRVVAVATARGTDLDPPALGYPVVDLDGVEVRGTVGVVDADKPTGIALAVGEFDSDTRHRNVATLIVSAGLPLPVAIVADIVDTDVVEIGDWEADTLEDPVTGRRFFQVYVDELVVVVEDGPFAEELVRGLRIRPGSADPATVTLPLNGPLREVERSPLGTAPTVLLSAGDVVLSAARGPSFVVGAEYERVALGIGEGGYLGSGGPLDGERETLQLLWQPTWGTWLTLTASERSQGDMFELARQVTLVGPEEWSAVYG